jgi:hypothetical protein
VDLLSWGAGRPLLSLIITYYFAVALCLKSLKSLKSLNALKMPELDKLIYSIAI